jgi:hypothetical protein
MAGDVVQRNDIHALRRRCEGVGAESAVYSLCRRLKASSKPAHSSTWADAKQLTPDSCQLGCAPLPLLVNFGQALSEKWGEVGRGRWSPATGSSDAVLLSESVTGFAAIVRVALGSGGRLRRSPRP